MKKLIAILTIMEGKGGFGAGRKVEPESDN
jgi:hypothetical protein